METTPLRKLALFTAAALLAACDAAEGQSIGKGTSGSSVDVSPGESLAPAVAARIGVYFPNGGACANTINRMTIQAQGTGSLVTTACQSLNGPLAATFEAVVTTNANGLATVSLAPQLATWQGSGCTIAAGAPGLVSARFSDVDTATMATAIAADAQSCTDYCSGGPRAPSCTVQCQTFTTIHTLVGLTPQQIAGYESTSAFDGVLYLNMLR